MVKQTKKNSKNGSKSKHRAKVKTNLIMNPELFQMQYLMIPGTLEPSETPVTPSTQNEPTRLSENCDKDDTEDENDDEYPPPDTPCLMREIDEAISRQELGVFHVDESEPEEDQEGHSATENNETETNPRNKEVEDDQQVLEEETSDTDSTTTVEFTASDLADRVQGT